MKASFPTAFAVALLTTSSFLSGLARAEDYPESEPLLPVGFMTAYPTLVQTGTHPTLNWGIMHPAKIEAPDPGVAAAVVVAAVAAVAAPIRRP